MPTIYNTIQITTIKDRTFRYTCNNEADYIKYLKDAPDAVEIIGEYGQQIKPIFDIDAFGDDIDINEVKNIISSVFPNKKIVYAKRDARDTKKGIKYSYRFYVLGVRITSKFLKQLLIEKKINDNKIFDLSIYDTNKVLFLPLTTEKVGDIVPPLTPIDCDLLDCCASYIEESYENWDLLYKKEEPKKVEIKKVEVIEDETDDENMNISKLYELITKLKKHRATDREDWLNGCWAVINICNKNEVRMSKVYELVHLFSAIDGDNYDEKEVEKWLDINYKGARPNGYGWKFLLNWLKEDNPEYYAKLTKVENLIDGANDDVGASNLVIKKYKNLMVISRGIFYILENDIWIYGDKDVDKVLSNLIISLDIKFVGADNKRTYSYSNSVKHQRDCVVAIRNNREIIDDEFYDKLINNSKYYLPFKNGIYSFKENKLLKYSELPNVYFTQKINRDYMPKIDADYKLLLEKVINPIYPDKKERDYNAHIKARALAGCYEDKKWYVSIGSRNSGKGVETKILKNSFGNFVSEFNSKCLIKQKFGNPDAHRALSWVADKKNARIIISNEIDGDDETTINGNFIKTLASGGDAMKARQIYEKNTEFIPQFTMFLNCNKLYNISPEDAMENLEQFNYKSKFVEADELIDGVSFLKLKDDNIKNLINEDKYINAYIHYILDAFTLIRQKAPEIIKNSTNIGKIDEKLNIEQFIIKNFKNTNNDDDRLHTQDITDILKNNGYKVSLVESGRLLNSIGIGKYNDKCNINKVRKGGFLYIKYIGDDKTEDI